MTRESVHDKELREAALLLERISATRLIDHATITELQFWLQRYHDTRLVQPPDEPSA